jgi:hypothetical protein
MVCRGLEQSQDGGNPISQGPLKLDLLVVYDDFGTGKDGVLKVRLVKNEKAKAKASEIRVA